MRVILGCLLAWTLGCSATSEAQSESDFAVLPTAIDDSILTRIEGAKGAPEVCVGFVEFDASARGLAQSKIPALVEGALNKWNALLQDSPDWTLKRPIVPKFNFQTGECSPRRFDFSVNVWATVEAFKADRCRFWHRNICAPSADTEERVITLGPWNRDRQVEALDPFVILHELGHLLGLGDTYRIPGLNEFVGEQPPSVMNGASTTLTEDDKLGLWATLRAVRTGIRSCEGFGEKVQTKSAWKTVMCDPRARATLTHPQPKNPR